VAGHQSESNAVWFPWRELNASDQYLDAQSILQGVQSGHRVGECGYFVASEPKGIDSLLRESWVVVNNDDAGRHWDLPLGCRSSTSKIVA
jgi:hypothetical protein